MTKKLGALASVSDLMLALGEAHADQTRAMEMGDQDGRIDRSGGQRATRGETSQGGELKIEEQERSETYSRVANDFDQLNARLSKKQNWSRRREMASAELWRCSKASERCASRREHAA